MLSRERAGPLRLLLVIHREENWKNRKFLGGGRKVIIERVDGPSTLENPSQFIEIDSPFEQEYDEEKERRCN